MERENIVRAGKISLKRIESKAILSYLKEERGFSDSIIDEFDFGYCPPEITHELSGRIIIPIYDSYRKLVALSSRHIDKNHHQKFWHESFDKGSHIYGLCYAKRRIIDTHKAILVEGEFDVAALHANGFDMTVGVCGSSLTLFQIALLIRYCSEIYLMFDGDEAGKKAVERAMALYQEHKLKSVGVNFIPIFLPQGIDPDDFIRIEGRMKLREKLKIARENQQELTKNKRSAYEH